MAEGKDGGIQEKELLERLGRIEDKIRNQDKLRTRQRLYSVIGVLVILIFFGVFIYRIGAQINWYRTSLQDPIQRTILLKQIIEDSHAQQLLATEGQLFIAQLKSEVLPEVQSAVATQMQRVMPDLRSAVLEMGGRLQDKTRKEIEEKLVEAMIRSFEAMETDLQKTFPEFSEKDIEEQLTKNKDYFVAELHDMIEDRLAGLQASLEALKTIVGNLGKEVEKEGLSPDQAEALFLDAILELLAYELKPELGNEPAK